MQMMTQVKAEQNELNDRHEGLDRREAEIAATEQDMQEAAHHMKQASEQVVDKNFSGLWQRAYMGVHMAGVVSRVHQFRTIKYAVQVATLQSRMQRQKVSHEEFKARANKANSSNARKIVVVICPVWKFSY